MHDHQLVSRGIDFTQALVDQVVAWWPQITGGVGTVAAAYWPGRRVAAWLQRRVRIGWSHLQLAKSLQRAEDARLDTERMLKFSEAARLSMRSVIDDIQRTLAEQDARIAREREELLRQEREMARAREQIAYLEAMLEVRVANEYALFQDRTNLVRAIGVANARLQALGGEPVAIPEFLGLHVASPEAESAMEAVARAQAASLT